MKRKKTAVVVFVVLLAVLGTGVLPGCAPKEAPTVQPTEAPTEVPTEAPPKELVILQADDPPSIDPVIPGEVPGANLAHNLYDALMTIDREGKLAPGLALSCEPVSDTQWRFKLREGVEFHNGERFDARSVKFTLDRLLDIEAGVRFWDFTTLFDRVEVVDDYTVDIITKVPTTLVPMMSTVMFALPPEHGAKMGEDFGQEPVGTGPYKFVEWLPKQRLVLEANESYWGGKPPFDRVIFRPVPELTTRVAELETGRADIAIMLDASAAERLEVSEQARAVAAPGARVLVFDFNLMPGELRGPEPFYDVRVRQAFNYAIDKQAIIDAVLRGHAFQRGGISRPDYFGYDASASEPYPYDLDKAKQLMAEAGYPDGFETEIWTTPRFTSGLEVAEAVQAQLAQIGIKSEVVSMDWALYRDIIFSHEKPMPGIWAYQYGCDFPDPDEVLSGMYSTDGNVGNSSWKSDPKLDEMVYEAKVETDLEKRAEIYSEIQKYMRDDAFSIWMWQWADIYGVSNRIEWTPRFDQVIKVMEVNLAE